MTYQLDDARCKVVRAQKHLESLNDEIRRYVDSRPYDIPLKIEGDLASVDLIITAEPPKEVSFIVGDCLTNLRAALDYIAWELAARYHTTQPVEGQDIISFPIAKGNLLNPESRAKLAKYSIPANALDEIERVQPYHAGYESIRFLDALVNADKHRRLLLCVAILSGADRIWICWRDKGWYNPGGTGIGVGLSAHGIAHSEEEPVKVKVEGQVTIYIAIKNPLVPLFPVDLLLGDLIERTQNIIKRFEPFF